MSLEIIALASCRVGRKFQNYEAMHQLCRETWMQAYSGSYNNFSEDFNTQTCE
jgi:hypothetical protein